MLLLSYKCANLSDTSRKSHLFLETNHSKVYGEIAMCHPWLLSRHPYPPILGSFWDPGVHNLVAERGLRGFTQALSKNFFYRSVEWLVFVRKLLHKWVFVTWHWFPLMYTAWWLSNLRNVCIMPSLDSNGPVPELRQRLVRQDEPWLAY